MLRPNPEYAGVDATSASWGTPVLNTLTLPPLKCGCTLFFGTSKDGQRLRYASRLHHAKVESAFCGLSITIANS